MNAPIIKPDFKIPFSNPTGFFRCKSCGEYQPWWTLLNNGLCIDCDLERDRMKYQKGNSHE